MSSTVAGPAAMYEGMKRNNIILSLWHLTEREKVCVAGISPCTLHSSLDGKEDRRAQSKRWLTNS